MRRAEPDDGEERLAGLPRALDDGDRLADDDLGAFALEDFRRAAVARERRIQLEEVVVRQPLVESHRAGVGRRGRLHRADVPLAEMPAVVAGLGEQVGDGDLLRPQRPTRREGAHAVRVASGQEAAAGRRATRMRGVEALEPQAGGGHLVEHRRLEMRMAVVAGLLPAVVVAHQEDDVGALRMGGKGKEKRGEERDFHRRRWSL